MNILYLNLCQSRNKENPGFIEDFDEKCYNDIQGELRQWILKHGTTKSIAKYVLETIC